MKNLFTASEDRPLGQPPKSGLLWLSVVFIVPFAAILAFGFGKAGWELPWKIHNSTEQLSIPQIKRRQLDAEIAAAILTKTVVVGMSPTDVIASIGEPRSRNITKTANATFEQWVYYSTYVYFENGTVTSCQFEK